MGNDNRRYGFFDLFRDDKDKVKNDRSNGYGFFDLFTDNNRNKNNGNSRNNNLKKRMDFYDLNEYERDAVRHDGYDPEDFEEEELDPDDYYNDN
jgi:hypothetical protein